MTFNYSAVISAAPDTGDFLVIFRPEVRIAVHGPRGSKSLRALVDTGADNTIMPECIARELGIPLIRAQGPAARAFGGQEVSLSYSDVDLELIHADSTLRWTSRVYFLAEGGAEETIIQGGTAYATIDHRV